MTAIEALDHLRAQGITLTCTGATLRVSPRHLVTPAVSELIQTYKPDLLTLLAADSPPSPCSEAGALSPAVERQAQQQGESHVPGASDSHASMLHSPQCLGHGLVVVPGVGWSCPTCDRRYFVPTVPAQTTPAQAALPLGARVQPGEMVPQRKGRR